MSLYSIGDIVYDGLHPDSFPFQMKIINIRDDGTYDVELFGGYYHYYEVPEERFKTIPSREELVEQGSAIGEGEF